jgi:hypothetical protein
VVLTSRSGIKGPLKQNQGASGKLSQETLSQEIFTKNDLFREVRAYCELKGSGLE